MMKIESAFGSITSRFKSHLPHSFQFMSPINYLINYLLKTNYYNHIIHRIEESFILNSFFNILILFFILIIPLYFFSMKWFSKFAPFLKKSHIFEEDRRTICILGGGFGGFYTALSIAKKIKSLGRNKENQLYKAKIFLVDKKKSFVFSPLLYELAVDTCSNKEVAPRYEDLIKGYEEILSFIEGNVDSIDINRKLVYIIPSIEEKEKMKLESSKLKKYSFEEMKDNDPSINDRAERESIAFDQLVLALGSKPNSRSIEGFDQYGFTFHSDKEANLLRKRFESLYEMTKSNPEQLINIHIVGGGYSGIELATNISERFFKRNCKLSVICHTDKVLNSAPQYNQYVGELELDRHGVKVEYDSKVTRVLPNSVVIVKNGHEHEERTDLVIFAGGNCQTDVIKNLSMPKSESGKILTRDTLQTIENDFVFALGDCAKVEGQRLPATAQVAMQQSNTLAYNLQVQWKEFLEEEDFVDSNFDLDRDYKRNKEYKSFSFLNLGEMASFGDQSATVSAMGGYFNVRGFIASYIRRLVYCIRMPTYFQVMRAFFYGSFKFMMKKYKELFQWK